MSIAGQSNATASVDVSGGTLTNVAALNVAGGNYSSGTLVQTNTDLNVTGNFSVASGGAQHSEGSTILKSLTAADYIALWDAGMLRKSGESGLTGKPFGSYFSVTGEVLSPLGVLPIGTIGVAASGGNITITWSSAAGQPYEVQGKSDLQYDPSWTALTNVTGTGAEMSVDLPATNNASYFQVTTP